MDLEYWRPIIMYGVFVFMPLGGTLSLFLLGLCDVGKRRQLKGDDDGK